MVRTDASAEWVAFGRLLVMPGARENFVRATVRVRTKN